MMNGHDHKAREAAREAAKMKELKDRTVRLAQSVSNQVSLDIVDMIAKKHPGLHPGICSAALVNAMASIIVLFAKDEANAIEGADRVHAQLKSIVIGMIAEANRKKMLH